MGAEVDARHFTREDRKRHRQKVRRGLDVLLRMPPADVPEFFERFFSSPPERQRAYLGAHDDVHASLGAMLAVFEHLSPRLRGHLLAGALLGAGRDRPC